MRVGKGDGEGKLRDAVGNLGRVPGRDRRVGPVADPHLGFALLGPVVGQLFLEQPGQVCRPERRRPWRVRRQRYQRAIGVADVWFRLPAQLGGFVEGIVHEAVAHGRDRFVPAVGGPVKP